MTKHLFHETIGDIFDDENFPSKGITILKDAACGGDHTLPLFCSEERSYTTRYACADLMILKEQKVKVIIEIEESNVKPVHIFGKFLASAISEYYIYGKEKYEMDESVLFIQVLDTSKQKNVSIRKAQWTNIEESIRAILPFEGTSIREYAIFYGDKPDFKKGEKKDNLVEFVRGALKY